MNDLNKTSSQKLIRWRTFALVMLPLLAPFAFTLLYVPEKNGQLLSDMAQQKATVLAAIFAANAAPQVAFEDTKGLNALIQTATKDPDVAFVQVTAPDGKMLASAGSSSSKFALDLARMELGLDANSALIVASATIRKESMDLGNVQIVMMKKRINEANRSFWITAALFCVAVMILAAFISFLLGRSFSQLFEQLRQSLFKTANRVDGMVNQLAAVTAQQTAAAAEEASALHETNTTASSVAQAASASAQRASALIEGGAQAEQGASVGLEAASSATQAMREVREQMATITGTIGSLSERAAAIGEIASTVALLAERSNLLALNAAIEAARAGTQGRGFSVVAQEMRSLADGSNRSAGQVKAIIGEIQTAISKAVNDVREGERRVQNTEQMSNRAGDSIRRFAEVTREFAVSGKDIAQSASQQSLAIETMVESIGHATQASSTQLETTKQVEETALQLRQLSRELLGALGTTTEALSSGGDTPGAPRTDVVLPQVHRSSGPNGMGAGAAT